jgi:hypothetical protein
MAVCLHCRHEARLAARARFRRTSRSVGLVGLGVAAAAALGVVIVKAVRGVASSPAHHASQPATTAARASASSAHTETLAASTSSLAPSIGDGRADLGDGLYAVRAGDTVTVHFDTPDTRTRRRDKFERVVRATLPRIYDARIDSVLAHIPAGQLVPPGNLPADLTERGVRISLGDGWTLALWPEVRPADGGPLVVAYRATLRR